jgi:hypothetical protein
MIAWTKDAWNEYLTQYLLLSETEKERFGYMFIPHENTKIMGQALVVTMKLLDMCNRLDEIGFDMIRNLIVIAMANSHTKAIYSKLFSMEDQPHALSPMGCLIVHSCLPNLLISSVGMDGYVDYKVIRPIQREIYSPVPTYQMILIYQHICVKSISWIRKVSFVPANNVRIPISYGVILVLNTIQRQMLVVVRIYGIGYI